MSNNDADAFRHAYASGVFTLVHNSLIANVAGIKREMDGDNPINQQNMDLWKVYDSTVGNRTIKGPNEAGSYSILDLYEINKNWFHPKLKNSIKRLIFSLPIKDIRSIKQI